MAKLTKEQLEWVYKQDWFPKFCANLVKFSNLNRWEKLINDKPTELISGAFVWDCTQECHYYWSYVNKEWKAYLKESSKTVLTIDEIAKKFGVDPKNIRIVKE